MWLYRQSTGELFRRVGIGYSGAPGDGKNNPLAQAEANVGPIPAGRWLIGPAYDTPTHGPLVLPLAPQEFTETFGRSGFLIHGDSIKEPGTASEGCIIMARGVREAIADSGDQELVVEA